MSRSLTYILKRHAEFQHVVPFIPEVDGLVQPDLSASNADLTPAIMKDIFLFSEWFDNLREKSRALYAIGGYAEHRTVYANSSVFDGDADRPDRRFHLGVDIWGEALTPVMSPLPAKVHSKAFNDRKGDYGATVILEHDLEGKTFFTLYGHLSKGLLDKLYVGKDLEPGEAFAEFGLPAENGNWPPHLHFQIIDELGDRAGDYPGVCAFEEKDKWLHNSPDPDLILQMRKYLR